ncbi:hypothetical protein [Thauera butanivorans]|uniref:hypothetical protein n=1 Tax=Thauera butanivorans TaxID=86174 RepID=UPI000B27E1E9|nr:hypothetical protein [Thauera butanivorans]
MSLIPTPLVPRDDDLIPVTVCLTPVQADRLERLLAHCRDHSGLDDESVADMVFETGLQVAEQAING